MTAIEKFQLWYSQQCDGVWEHGFGVKIGTLDNPGWSVKVDLTGTAIADHPFAPVHRERSALSWISCKVEGNVFKGYGGPENLLEIIELFTEWTELGRGRS